LPPLAALLLAACASAPKPAPTPAAPSPLDARAEFRHAVDSMVADPQFANAHWGILVVNPRTGDTLYSHNAGKLFMPASNQKIVTGTVTLAELGPEYRWRTTFAARGPVDGGVLRGDLVVIGTGDPAVSDHAVGDAMAPLRAAADSLAAHGVRRIAGRVIAGGNAFPDSPYGFGWAFDDFAEPYSAGVDELFFNEGYSEIIVKGAASAGGAATVYARPATMVPALRIDVRTVAPLPVADSAARRRPGAGLDVALDSASTGYVVRGQIAAGDTAVLRVAHRDARAAYLAALTEALVARGITVDARAGVAPADTARADTLFALLSPPLRAVFPVMEKPSQNQIAEILFKTLGRERTGVGSADSGRRVVERRLRAWGVEPDRDIAVRDGSGLSRHDYVTPEALVRILAAVRRDTAFRVFYDALPIAGVDGTIASRMKGTPAAGNVHAKTGTVDKARSLSGYVTTADGELLVFSMLCNNFTVPTRAVERVQDAVAARLAAMRVRAQGGATATVPPTR
jgi:D-alanyl-D-alanine carboxypeptidase/D-alanyl-D-alanine-endopeptidase (penicillin-binding protein 4)